MGTFLLASSVFLIRPQKHKANILNSSFNYTGIGVKKAQNMAKFMFKCL